MLINCNTWAVDSKGFQLAIDIKSDVMQCEAINKLDKFLEMTWK